MCPGWLVKDSVPIKCQLLSHKVVEAKAGA